MFRALPFLALLAAPFVQPSTFAERWASVAAFYRQRLHQAGIVGSSLVFVRDGTVAAKALEGLQDATAKRPVDENTIYHWASITKTFTGVAIMQLRDRGLLSLDDPVINYVPELRDVHNPFGEMSQVTIRHLMSHSGGFRASTWPWGGDRKWHPFEPTRWEQLVAMFPYTELLFKPGTKYSYSNPGIIFLGRIIEHFSGDPYEVYITKISSCRSACQRASSIGHRITSWPAGRTATSGTRRSCRSCRSTSIPASPPRTAD